VSSGQKGFRCGKKGMFFGAFANSSIASNMCEDAVGGKMKTRLVLRVDVRRVTP